MYYDLVITIDCSPPPQTEAARAAACALQSPGENIYTRTQKIFAIFGAGRGRAGRAGRDRGAAVHRARIQVPDADAGCSVHIYHLYKYFYVFELKLL